MEKYLINKGLKYYTDMSIILEPIKELLVNYNFLISDFECNYYPSDRIIWSNDYTFISAIDFFEIVSTHEIQFIWGVFSAIPQDISLSDILKYELPYADGLKSYELITKLQHPLSIFEIVAIDSSSLEIYSNDQSIIEYIKVRFPKKYYYQR